MFKNYVFCFIAIFFTLLANAQIASTGMEEEQNIYDKIDDAPLNIVAERQLTFQELYAGKPVLLALVYTRCTGVCNPFLIQLSQSLSIKNNSYNVLVLSFDPRDNLNDMEQLAKRLALNNNKKWKFATTNRINELTKSVGFTTIWDSTKQQYEHDALLVGINRDGYITKKLIGIRQGHDLDLLIASINNEFSATYRLPTRNSMFSCFNYDPSTGKSSPGFGLLFIALPAIITILLLIFISYFAHAKSTNK